MRTHQLSLSDGCVADLQHVTTDRRHTVAAVLSEFVLSQVFCMPRDSVWHTATVLPILLPVRGNQPTSVFRSKSPRPSATQLLQSDPRSAAAMGWIELGPAHRSEGEVFPTPNPLGLPLAAGTGAGVTSMVQTGSLEVLHGLSRDLPWKTNALLPHI
jgi:hypothetical protein